jgi:hypothetical protein
MYSTCLHCHGALGANDEIESFPVGRRLAFDANNGRLWVVCPSCQRWNLSPLEERWETVERAEAMYRDTPTRVATDQIGLAKRRSGLELIRIGAPLRPEFAAWRYGGQLRSRFRRQWFERGMRAIEDSGQLNSIGWLMALGHPVFIVAGVPILAARVARRGWRAASRIQGIVVDGTPLEVRGRHLGLLRLESDRDARWRLVLTHANGVAYVAGDAVMPTLGRLLPHINDVGASDHQVTQAVAKIEHFGRTDRLLDFLVQRDGSGSAAFAQRIGYEQRLALEMMAHEESERRALDGELAALRAEWEDAERIAAIADRLLIPDRIQAMLRR